MVLAIDRAVAANVELIRSVAYDFSMRPFCGCNAGAVVHYVGDALSPRDLAECPRCHATVTRAEADGALITEVA